MVIHPKHDGPYLTIALVICEENNKLFIMPMCVKTNSTLPHIANPVNTNKISTNFKFVFPCTVSNIIVKVEVLFILIFLSSGKFQRPDCFLCSIFLLPLYFRAKRENVCTWLGPII